MSLVDRWRNRGKEVEKESAPIAKAEKKPTGPVGGVYVPRTPTTIIRPPSSEPIDVTKEDPAFLQSVADQLLMDLAGREDPNQPVDSNVIWEGNYRKSLVKEGETIAEGSQRLDKGVLPLLLTPDSHGVSLLIRAWNGNNHEYVLTQQGFERGSQLIAQKAAEPKAQAQA